MPFSPVSISNDLVMPLNHLSMTFHDVQLSGPVPLMKSLPCVEPPVMMLWGIGFALFQNKLTTTVFHKAMPIVLEAHDCGYGLPHVSMPPANLLTPIHIAFSKRKIAFSASKVKANSKSIGCTWALMPMVCCSQPFAIPIGSALLNGLNTVVVGVTWFDYFFGLVELLMDWLIDKILKITSVFKKLKEQTKALSDDVLDIAAYYKTELFKKLILGDAPKKWLAKTAMGLLVGACKVVTIGEGTVLEAKFGSEWLGAKITLSREKNGTYSESLTGKDSVLIGVEGVRTHSYHPDGSTTKKESTTEVRSGSGSQPVHWKSTSTKQQVTNRDGSSTYVEKNETIGTKATPWSGESHVESSKVTIKGTESGQIQKSTQAGGYEGGSYFGKSWGMPL